MIPPKPERFEILCHDIGLALLLGQKVQFALSYYFGVHQAVCAGWSKTQVEEKVKFLLSKPMGVVVGEIKQAAPLPAILSSQVDTFKANRNWLVHDFDEESTPHISRGQKIDHYISRLEGICADAQEIMIELDKIGDDLLLIKGVDPQTVNQVAEEGRNKS
jgi:hypothetical protein